MYISILRSTIRTRHSVFAIVSVLATPGVRRGGASVGVGVGVVGGGDTVGYGEMGYGGIGRRRMGVWGGWPCDPLCRPPPLFAQE